MVMLLCSCINVEVLMFIREIKIKLLADVISHRRDWVLLLIRIWSINRRNIGLNKLMSLPIKIHSFLLLYPNLYCLLPIRNRNFNNFGTMMINQKLAIIKDKIKDGHIWRSLFIDQGKVKVMSEDLLALTTSLPIFLVLVEQLPLLPKYYYLVMQTGLLTLTSRLKYQMIVVINMEIIFGDIWDRKFTVKNHRSNANKCNRRSKLYKKRIKVSILLNLQRNYRILKNK